MNSIDARELCFRYPAGEDDPTPELVLDNVSIQVREGEFLAVLGHNGSGKSTFAKHLNAILLPEGGTVWVDGNDTKDENNLLAIRETAGMVFQNPDNQRWPPSWKRTWPLPRKTWAFLRRRSPVGWMPPCRPWA